MKGYFGLFNVVYVMSYQMLQRDIQDGKTIPYFDYIVADECTNDDYQCVDDEDDRRAFYLFEILTYYKSYYIHAARRAAADKRNRTARTDEYSSEE